MLLLLVSTLMVIVHTIVCVVKVHIHKDKLKNMTGMTVAMLLGMASSLTIGLIAGIQFKGNLSLSTILCIIFSLIVGLLVGKSINLLVLVEGIGAGVMGGMMGAMLGEMLPQDNFTLMLVFMDILFIMSTLCIIILINAELKNAGNNISLLPRIYPWIITSIISVVILLAFTQLGSETMVSKKDGLQDHQHHHE
ncbi:hypothetical protein [Peribacillus sp. SCS-155]|uniref:hypothetical protein n=1 Tax=Peribacillus sedimenti TaxID=3115297 RepID=UPI00390597D5